MTAQGHHAARTPHVLEFADLEEQSFIEAAYRATLGRQPDPGGAAHYRALLDRGIGRAEILRYMIDSPEGRALGNRVEGLVWESRWARMRRLPVIGRWLCAGSGLWPWGAGRDLRRLTYALSCATRQIQTLEGEAMAREQAARLRFDALRAELTASLATRASAGELAALLDAKADTDAVIALDERVQAMDTRKADNEAIVDACASAESALRSVDDLDKMMNALLENHAVVNSRLEAMRGELERQVQALDAKKADTALFDSVKDEVHTALRTALTGLTGAVNAVAANTVGRAALNGMLAENSRAILAEVRDSIEQLRSSIEELSAR